jgi:methylase of polypeptide subunit release factors
MAFDRFGSLPPGAGQMAQALSAAGLHVTATDISTGQDFLLATAKPVDAIVTNPPYALAQEFIEHALVLTKPNGMVAMLLRRDFDHAKTRQHLFGECPQFAKKLVLTKRIRWIEGSNGSPSFNHAWQIWDWNHEGPPTLAYGP